MVKLFLSVCCSIMLLFLSVPAALAQSDTKEDIHLFQSFFRDAPIASAPYANGLGEYSNFDFFSYDRVLAGVQGGYAFTPELAVSTGVYYMQIDPDQFTSESGIADIPVFGRYNFINDDTQLSGGAFFTIPVGSEDIGQSNVDFGIFGAVRHPVSDYVVITGTLGIDFLDTAIGDRQASLNLGGGVIYATSDVFSIIGEFRIQSETEFSSLSGGIDYEVSDLVHLRANLLLGLDDGAPDYGLSGGFLVAL